MPFSNDRLLAIHPGKTGTISDSPGIRYSDAVHYHLPGGEAWVFDYGILVLWGVDFEERQALFQRLGLDDHLKELRQEQFRFVMNAPATRISRDTIELADDNLLTRLAISHALAQSLKLIEFEEQAQQTIQKYSHLPKELATRGRIALRRRDIARIRGNLFSTKSDIILHYGLLDTPEFFWEFPEYETTYNNAARYLEMRQRVVVLSKKLETIHELFVMLADEQKHRHSAFLEWIIIVLIAIEIVIFVAEEIQTLL